LHGFNEFCGLIVVMQSFNRLLQADGDEQADDDGGYVEEEIFPRVRGAVQRVDVKHESSPGMSWSV
jgi:hypothetical protein